MSRQAGLPFAIEVKDLALPRRFSALARARLSTLLSELREDETATSIPVWLSCKHRLLIQSLTSAKLFNKALQRAPIIEAAKLDTVRFIDNSILR